MAKAPAWLPITNTRREGNGLVMDFTFKPRRLLLDMALLRREAWRFFLEMTDGLDAKTRAMVAWAILTMKGAKP